MSSALPNRTASPAIGDADHPERLRLLVLSPFAPRLDARQGGARITAQMVAALAQRHAVALLCLRAPGERPVDPALRARCARVDEIARPAPPANAAQRWRCRARLLAGLLRGHPIWATEFSVPAYSRALRALAERWAPHIVQVEYHIMAQYLPALGACAAPRVLVEYEAGVRAAADARRAARGVVRLLHELELRAWRAFERRATGQVQAIVVFSNDDGLALSGIAPGVTVLCIPPGAMVPARPADPLGTEQGSLLFIGNYAHPPNVDAARRLVRAIFPQVRRHCPYTTLYLVGAEPTPEMRAWNGPGVVVTGPVPDVAPYLDRAAVVVAPLRLGGGVRIKVLEALAAGKAIVASSLAVEGLGLRDGEQIIIADSDEQFAAALVALLVDPTKRATLAQRARTWACANLGWEDRIAAYDALYRRLITIAGQRSVLR